MLTNTPWFSNHPPGTTFAHRSLELFPQHCFPSRNHAWQLLLGSADVQGGLQITWWVLEVPSSLQTLRCSMGHPSFCSSPTGMAVFTGLSLGSACQRLSARTITKALKEYASPLSILIGGIQTISVSVLWPSVKHTYNFYLELSLSLSPRSPLVNENELNHSHQEAHRAPFSS